MSRSDSLRTHAEMTSASNGSQRTTHFTQQRRPKPLGRVAQLWALEVDRLGRGLGGQVAALGRNLRPRRFYTADGTAPLVVRALAMCRDPEQTQVGCLQQQRCGHARAAPAAQLLAPASMMWFGSCGSGDSSPPDHRGRPSYRCGVPRGLGLERDEASALADISAARSSK